RRTSWAPRSSSGCSWPPPSASSSSRATSPSWSCSAGKSTRRQRRLHPCLRPRTGGRTKMVRRLLVLALVLAGAGAGCTLGPNYNRPAVPVPPTWRDMQQAEAESLANAPWWTIFDDEVLQELIRVALDENKDLKIRVEEARAQYGFTKADIWPQIDLSATAGRLRFNAGSLVHTPEGDQNPNPEGTETSIYSVTAHASWA